MPKTGVRQHPLSAWICLHLEFDGGVPLVGPFETYGLSEVVVCTA